MPSLFRAHIHVGCSSPQSQGACGSMLVSPRNWSLAFAVAALLACSVASTDTQCPFGFYICPDGLTCATFNSTCNQCSGIAGQLVCPMNAGCALAWSDCVAKLAGTFWDSSMSVDARIANLISSMTLAEKIAQLMPFTPAIERLGVVPYVYLNEALHGVARQGLATEFPMPISMASSFSRDVLKRVGLITATEGRAKYNQAIRNQDFSQGVSFYTPNINIVRDPRWGRTQETYGEDPFLSGELSVHYVHGMQDVPAHSDTEYNVIACCKHFVAYSFENLGNLTRYSFDAIVSESDMSMTYLPHFRACVRDGQAYSVMCSYNSVNGVPVCSSDALQNGLLRDKWGFKGFIISDYDSVDAATAPFPAGHGFFPNLTIASAVSLKAGCDQDGGKSYETLSTAIQEGMLAESDIDVALTRVIATRFKTGLFDGPDVSWNSIPYSVVDSAAHQQASLETAIMGSVLLKNENNTLPLNLRSLRTIAVIGPNANSTRVMLGNYEATPAFVSSALYGITARAAVAGVSTTYAPGCLDVLCPNTSGFAAAVQVAQSADAVVLVMGLSEEVEDEMNDRTSLSFPGFQEELIKTVMKTTKGPVVVVLISGASIAMPWTASNAPAILEAWYAGERGGDAIAAILFGDANPAGRLPITWYKSLDQVPPMVDMDMRAKPFGRTYRYFTDQPLYPFGHGLSYTSFVYSTLILPESISVCGSLKVAFEIMNVGGRDGDEVPQLYFALKNSTADAKPQIQLGGFERVFIAANNSVQVTFIVTPEQRETLDRQGRLVVEPGPLTVWVGGGQPGFSSVLVGTVNILGPVVPVDRCLRTNEPQTLPKTFVQFKKQ